MALTNADLHPYINLREEDLDRVVYRILSFQRLLEMMGASLNTLVRPRLWDDPFENFVLNARAKIGKERLSIGFRDQLYGQCWTLQRDSDAMWRIYSPDKQGVRLRTTIRGLLQSLQTTCDSHPALSCFVGKVRYLKQELLLEQLADKPGATAAILDPTGRGQATSLLAKRKEFSHEKEVRLIYFNHDKHQAGDIYQYQIDPLFLFDEVTFDPRLSDELFEVYEAHVRSMGFSNVNRSSLYRLPALETHLLV